MKTKRDVQRKFPTDSATALCYGRSSATEEGTTKGGCEFTTVRSGLANASEFFPWTASCERCSRQEYLALILGSLLEP